MHVQDEIESFRVVILVHAGDLVISGPSKDEVNWAEGKPGLFMKLRDLGEVRYYLGVPLRQKRIVTGLNQAAYCRRVLDRFRMDRAKAAPTPQVDGIANLFEGGVSGEAGLERGRGIQ